MRGEARLIKFTAVTYIDFISNIKHHELCLIGLQLNRDSVNNITVVAPNQGGLQKPARATVCDLQDVDNLTKGRDNSAGEKGTGE